MEKERFVKITEKEYRELLENNHELGALFCAGVNNWSGYGEHRSDDFEYEDPEEYINEKINENLMK